VNQDRCLIVLAIDNDADNTGVEACDVARQLYSVSRFETWHSRRVYLPGAAKTPSNGTGGM